MNTRDALVNAPEFVGGACACDGCERNGTCELAAVRRAKVELAVLGGVPRGRGDEGHAHKGSANVTLRCQVLGDCRDGTGVAHGLLCQVDGSNAQNTVEALSNVSFVNL